MIISQINDPNKIPPLYDALHHAVTRSYKKFGYDYSITELIDSPRIKQLRARHPSSLVAPEPITALSSTIGTGVHHQFDSLLSGLPNYEVERTMYINIGNRRIKGRFDILYKLSELYDLKNTSTWKAIYGDFSDWYRQLNFYAYMLGVDSVKVTKLWAFVLYLDWNMKEARKGGKYPTSKTIAYQMKLESYTKIHDMFTERINLHRLAEGQSDNNLSKCLPTEMWAKPDIWAVYKDASKQERATKLFKNKVNAEKYAVKNKCKNVILRQGSRPRCTSYCDCKNICNQYQKYLRFQ